MVNLKIENQIQSKTQIEIVERKGLGHPDTICDLLVDQLSIRLSQIYKKEFGVIPHFNIDKALLAAGTTENRFGGGRIIKPMLFVIGDRATSQIGRKKINLNKIIKKEIYAFLKKNFRFINRKNFLLQNEIKQASSSLADIFKRQQKVMAANDTSALVGYAPMTYLEALVFNLEKFLNAKDFKKEFPETGEDIKIMGYRDGKKIHLVLAVAFIDKFIKSEKDYFEKKDKVKKTVEKYLTKNYPQKISFEINTLDKKGRGIAGCYLTVCGTSADSGDSGEVGRGNRVNGIIPLNRVAGSEASAGKNCVSHVGKIYNLLSFKIAQEIYQKTGKKNTVWLVSKIGQPVNQPALVSVSVEGLTRKEKEKVTSVVNENFLKIDKFIAGLIEGKWRMR
ncbi:MAG: methionine adenosyltransferase [Patescibacteria group bacterium]|nr:methionine adenosyltransferase [Patescibacteria group bacterium]